MKILALIDQNENISAFQERVQKHIPFLQMEVVGHDFSKAAWEAYKPGKLGLSKSVIQANVTALQKQYHNTLDIVMHFVSEENFEQGERRMNGWHLGSPVKGAEVTITRMRRDYEKTAEHEFVHCLDDIIYLELGIRLEQIFDVEDFDEDVVHGRDPRFEEYEYAEVYKRLLPHLERAYRKRLKADRRSLLEEVRRIGRIALAKLRSEAREFPVAPEAPSHPTELLKAVSVRADKMVNIFNTLGMPIRVTSGYRSFEEQNELYAQGRTAPGSIVTNARGGESFHNYGSAVDFVFRETGYDEFEVSQGVTNWELLGLVGEALGFEWGGSEKWIRAGFVDLPHFQLTNGHDLADFQAGRVDYSQFN